MKHSFQKLQFPRTAIKIVSYLLVLLPAALGFLYVYSFGVNVLVGDSWSVVPFFDRLSSGTLRIPDLLNLHSDHWVFFPRIAMLLLGTMTEWNSIAEFYLLQACLLGALICLLLAFRDSVKPRSAFFPLLIVPISLLIFSLREPVMLRGFQVPFAFVQMFGILTLYLLYVLRYESLRKAVFVAALGSATVASFSSAPGLFVWPAGLLQLFISPVEKPTKRVFIVLWGLVGLGEWIAYFIARASEGRETESLLSALAHPLVGIESFLRLLGSPLFGENLAFTAGLLLACLALVGLLLVYKDGRGLGEYSFWITLLFWSFLILASIVVENLTQENGIKLHGRYMPFSSLAMVSIYGLLATTALGRRLSIRRPSIRIILLVLLSGAVLLSAGISYPREIEVGSKEKERREEAAFVLSTYESQPEEVLEEYHWKSPEKVRRGAAVLERLGYNVFSESSN